MSFKPPRESHPPYIANMRVQYLLTVLCGRSRGTSGSVNLYFYLFFLCFSSWLWSSRRTIYIYIYSDIKVPVCHVFFFLFFLHPCFAHCVSRDIMIACVRVCFSCLAAGVCCISCILFRARVCVCVFCQGRWIGNGADDWFAGEYTPKNTASGIAVLLLSRTSELNCSGACLHRVST